MDLKERQEGTYDFEYYKNMKKYFGYLNHTMSSVIINYMIEEYKNCPVHSRGYVVAKYLSDKVVTPKSGFDDGDNE